MKSNKKTLLLLATATAFTLAVGSTYAFLFLVTKKITAETALLAEKIDELSGRESRTASSVSILRREDKNIQKISSYFFNESEVVSFAKKLEALGAQSGTKLTIEALDQGYTEKTVPFLNFRIKATGKFVDIERLLELLENFPGKLEWKTVRIVREEIPTYATQGNSTAKKIVTTNEPEWKAEVFLVALNFTNQ